MFRTNTIASNCSYTEPKTAAEGRQLKEKDRPQMNTPIPRTLITVDNHKTNSRYPAVNDEAQIISGIR